MVRIRITGGSLKGRIIAVHENDVARYTSSKAREAIFSMLKDVKGLNILDIFAGSGIFAIEALSRGAKSATFIEKDKRMVNALKANLLKLSLEKDCFVLNMDVRYAIPFLYKRALNYDIIFMDPPYEQNLIADTMALLCKHAVYNDGSVFVLEHSKREQPFPASTDGFGETISRRYGDTVISFINFSNKNGELKSK